jgi:hypothetical protein
MFQQNKYIFIIIGVVFIGSMAFNVIRRKSIKISGIKFFTENPNAVKIFISGKVLTALGTITVHTVDGEMPVFFSEGIKSGFYIIPGNRIVEMSFTGTRPGILYKTVTNTFGPVKKELIVESGKMYELGFDNKAENFTFKEM